MVKHHKVKTVPGEKIKQLFVFMTINLVLSSTFFLFFLMGCYHQLNHFIKSSVNFIVNLIVKSLSCDMSNLPCNQYERN